MANSEGIKPLLPGSTIGILGGGQLGRMIILEGKKMGYRFVTLDPSDDCPGSQVADQHIVAGYDDLEAARLLADTSDLITYEFENVDDAVVKILEEDAFLPQGGELLRVTRHRIREKRALVEAGVPITPYRVVKNQEELLTGGNLWVSPVFSKLPPEDMTEKANGCFNPWRKRRPSRNWSRTGSMSWNNGFPLTKRSP